jgi:uncharacterized repeat protein (TIGR01451 family)
MTPAGKLSSGRFAYRSMTLAAAAVVVMGVLAGAMPSARADLPATCGDVTLVLDESGSIGDSEVHIRTALHAFLGSLVGSEVAASVVEFGTSARTVLGSTPVTPANLSGVFGPYIDATGPGEIYDSPSQLGPWTNWDDALDEVGRLNTAAGVAPLVLLLTDGDPTAFNLDRAGEAGGVRVNAGAAEATARTVEEADEIRAQGSQIIAVGVGPGVSSADSVGRLHQVAGPGLYTGDGPLVLSTTGVVLVPDFADLAGAMDQIARAMCADPGISVDKSVDREAIVAGTTVTYQLIVTNTGNVPLIDVSVTDPAVPGCSRVIGPLAVDESRTILCIATLWGPLTNTATATGEDEFGNEVTDRDSARVSLVAGGTGTPGYWKNHDDVWPTVGDGIIVGDWDHDWVCDPDETCIPLSREQAAAALTAPPRGDMTWNLARPLVSAWFNVSAGNDASCVAAVIDLAAAWLQDHPIGSGIGGGDPAWREASSWAETLDAYNNGLACADHRDPEPNEPDAEPSSIATSPTASTVAVAQEPSASREPPAGDDSDAAPIKHGQKGAKPGKAKGHTP